MTPSSSGTAAVPCNCRSDPKHLMSSGRYPVTQREYVLSPQRYARAGGVLYLIIIATAMFAEAGVRAKVIVTDNPERTATNIVASQGLFRWGLTADLVNCVIDVVVAMILYALLKPVHRQLALLTASLRVAADVILAFSAVFQMAAIILLGGGESLHAFGIHQLQALAYLSMSLHGEGYGISLIFFGLGCEVLGYLIYRSQYLPRALGVMMFIAGAGYLFNSFAGIVSPSLAAMAFPWTLMPGFFAELALTCWLLFKGVNLPRWEAVVRM
jgi:hypothetical protein